MLYKVHKSDAILLKEAVEKLRKDDISGENKHLANDVELLAGRLEAIYNHENEK